MKKVDVSIKASQYLTILLMGLSIIVVLFVQIAFLEGPLFGDEAETIVVCKMMASGERLYNEIFNHHGPLTFFVGFIIELFGDFGIAVHRIPILLLQWCAFAAIFTSPLHKSMHSRFISTLLASTAMLGFLNQYYSYTYVYQTIAGMLIIIISTQLILPIMVGIRQEKWIVIACSFINACLPFLAITYAPIALLFLLLSLNKASFKEVLLASLISVAFNIAFLLITSSIQGYIAYHIYMNITILSSGVSFWILLKQSLIFLLMTPVGFFAFLFIAFATSYLAYFRKQEGLIRVLLLLICPFIVSLRATGVHFSAIPFWCFVISIFPVYGQMASNISSETRSSLQQPNSSIFAGFFGVFRKPIRYLPFLLIVLFCLNFMRILSPNGNQLNVKSNFSRIVKKITSTDDRILALTFANLEYLLSERLPASAHFFYLPFQAYYNERPILGIYSNLAEDIKKNKPKAIYADHWKVWDNDNYEWMKYASDVDQAISENYYKLEGNPIYIRNDIDLTEFGLSSCTGVDLKDFYVTDGNWNRGYSRFFAGFYVENCSSNKEKYSLGHQIRLPGNDTRAIVDLQEQGVYLHVYLEGSEFYTENIPLPDKLVVL